MPFYLFSSMMSKIIRCSRHLLMAAGLCLLVACGGGGGGGAASTPAAGSGVDPDVTFVRNDTLTTVYPSNTVSLLPHFTYGTGRISWTDSNNVARTSAVSTDAPFTDTPQQNTVYTLTVSFQDPSTVRPTTKTITKTISVTVTAISDAYPTCTLTANNANPLINSTVQLTSDCTWANGVITARSVVSSLQTSSITQGVPIVMQTPSTTGTFNYTQSVTYTDARISPNATQTHTYTATPVTITNDLTQVTSASSMSTARGDCTATLLSSNSLVLVAGGTTDGSAVVSTAELYDPATNTWRTTGAMTTARRGHTATLLSNGKVLVTGGTDGTAVLKTAEIYDPATGQWTATTASLRFTRRWHTATLLTDGTVLIVGGIVGSETSGNTTIDGSKITEIFDGNTFTSVTSQLPSAVQGHTATLLSNGSVLIAGRNNADGLAGAQTTAIYDFPKAVVGSTTANWYNGPPMGHGRYNHAATRLADNRVLVSGGFLSGITTELFTLSSAAITSGSNYGSWTAGPSMMNAKALHTTTLLRSGAVMAIGGYNGTSTLTSIEVLNSATSAWTTMPHTLSTGRAMHRSTLLSNVSMDPNTGVSIDKVLVMGTYMETGPNTNKTAELVWSP
jgi:hypothetical protein